MVRTIQEVLGAWEVQQKAVTAEHFFEEHDMTFRQWCYNKWMEHCDEVEAWTGQYPGPRYLSAEYFGKYKWWLRREYRAQMQAQSEPYHPFNIINS